MRKAGMIGMIATALGTLALASCIRPHASFVPPAPAADAREHCVSDYQYANCDLAVRHGGQLLADCREQARQKAGQAGGLCDAGRK
jgi:hypothetical protein